jgi:hypothetical protein
MVDAWRRHSHSIAALQYIAVFYPFNQKSRFSFAAKHEDFVASDWNETDPNSIMLLQSS